MHHLLLLVFILELLLRFHLVVGLATHLTHLTHLALHLTWLHLTHLALHLLLILLVICLIPIHRLIIPLHWIIGLHLLTLTTITVVNLSGLTFDIRLSFDVLLRLLSLSIVIAVRLHRHSIRHEVAATTLSTRRVAVLWSFRILQLLKVRGVHELLLFLLAQELLSLVELIRFELCTLLTLFIFKLLPLQLLLIILLVKVTGILELLVTIGLGLGIGCRRLLLRLSKRWWLDKRLLLWWWRWHIWLQNLRRWSNYWSW